MPKVKVQDVDAPVMNEEPKVVEEEEMPDVVSDDEEYDSYKMNPDEHVWEDGPTFGMVNEWKDKFGDVYITEYAPGKYAAWRTLTRFEYRRLVKNLEQAISTGQVSQAEANMNNEESIAEQCMLFPAYDRTASAHNVAGLASTIASQVMEASAFVSLDVRQL